MLEEPTIRLYHGTSAEYDEVDPAKLAGPNSAPNCALGLWLTNDREIASKFGTWLVTFEVPTRPCRNHSPVPSREPGAGHGTGARPGPPQ